MALSVMEWLSFVARAQGHWSFLSLDSALRTGGFPGQQPSSAQAAGLRGPVGGLLRLPPLERQEPTGPCCPLVLARGTCRGRRELGTSQDPKNSV